MLEGSFNAVSATLPCPAFSPPSFRVAVIADMLTQGVPLEDVQHLAGLCCLR